MGSKNLIFLWFVASFAARGLARPTFNVLDHGATGDGTTDDSDAFSETWTAACAYPTSPTLLVPSGYTFLLSDMKFEGPCESPVHVQVDGNIVAPKKVWSVHVDKWILFRDINGLIIDGSGQIDGNGAAWWKCRSSLHCSDAPDAFRIESCNDVQLSGLKFTNSPKKHVTIHNVVGASVSGISVTAPGDSPNTDGLHIQESQHVLVADSIIGTGDDCISIGTGTSDVNITQITCGPGHGISIGSLGAHGSTASVEQIHISFCSFQGTTNGVRIKTWQGGSGYAKGITFEHVNFTSVERPIVIDQYYCENEHNCPNKTSAVQVSDVHYIGAIGTSAGKLAITLNCSASVACTGITMDSVNIQSTGEGNVAAFCANALGSMDDSVVPSVSCLN